MILEQGLSLWIFVNELVRGRLAQPDIAVLGVIQDCPGLNQYQT